MVSQSADSTKSGNLDTRKKKHDLKKNGFFEKKKPIIIREKRGRPTLDLDVEVIEELAKWDCTIQEIASEVGCHQDTLYARDDLSLAIERGRKRGDKSLKRTMFEMALGGNVPLLIWLSKNRFGYRDRPDEAPSNVAFNINIVEIPK